MIWRTLTSTGIIMRPIRKYLLGFFILVKRLVGKIQELLLYLLTLCTLLFLPPHSTFCDSRDYFQRTPVLNGSTGNTYVVFHNLTLHLVS